jgi:hypothetical protein
MMKRFCGVNDCCYAGRLERDPSMCENFHAWDETIALTGEQVLAHLQARLTTVDKQIAEATCWGAYVSVLGDEQRNLRRRIAHWNGS